MSDLVHSTVLVPSPGRQPSRSATGMGLRVIMSRIPGLTPRSILQAPFLFQCPPLETFAQSYTYSFDTYSTIDKEQHARFSARELATFTNPTILVDFNDAWVLTSTDGFRPDPLELLEEIKEIADEGFPFRLLVHQQQLWGRPDISMPATIRGLNVEERAGEVDARYVEVQFSEHRAPELIDTGRKGRRAIVRGNDKTPAQVTVRADGSVSVSPEVAHPAWGLDKPDGPVTMHKLSAFFYGSYSDHAIIAAKNGLTVAPSQALHDALGVKGASTLDRGVLTVPRKGQ